MCEELTNTEISNKIKLLQAELNRREELRNNRPPLRLMEDMLKEFPLIAERIEEFIVGVASDENYEYGELCVEIYYMFMPLLYGDDFVEWESRQF